MLRLLDGGTGKLRVRRGSPEERTAREHGEQEARRLMAEGMAYFGMQPDDLAAVPKGDERKLAQAILISQRTTVNTARRPLSPFRSVHASGACRFS